MREELREWQKKSFQSSLNDYRGDAKIAFMSHFMSLGKVVAQSVCIIFSIFYSIFGYF